jgi:hypothetical protein
VLNEQTKISEEGKISTTRSRCCPQKALVVFPQIRSKRKFQFLPEEWIHCLLFGRKREEWNLDAADTPQTWSEVNCHSNSALSAYLYVWRRSSLFFGNYFNLHFFLMDLGQGFSIFWSSRNPNPNLYFTPLCTP